MTITIYGGCTDKYYLIECKRSEFIKEYGSIRFETSDLFKTMQAISRWVNNELEEECLFEVG